MNREKLALLADAAMRESWKTTLCSTGNYPDGWNHGATIDHSAQTYELSIFRIQADGKIVDHPASGKKWNMSAAIRAGHSATDVRELIDRVCDRIGLKCGSLKVYKQGLL